MKKFLVIKFLVIICIFIFSSPVTAFALDYQQEIENIANEYNVDMENISDITVRDIVNYIKEQRTDYINMPVRLLIKVSGVVLICRIVKVLADDKKTGIETVTDNICTLVIFLLLLEPVQEIITVVSENLFQVQNFMTAFLPLFASVSIASGQVLTSSVYTGFLLSGIIFISSFCIKVILPSIQVYFSLIVSNSLSTVLRLGSICEFYLKSVRWIMRSIVSVICFVLTLQTTLTASQETLALKAGKLLTGSAIPVIGSVLQDAVGSVYAGMKVIKGFAGVVGLLSVINIFLPSLILLAVYWLCINLMFILCDVFDLKSMGRCVKGFGSITELLMSVIILFMILLIFSLTIMISLTRG